MKPPFRADHVGSLLRPQALHAARARHKKGEIDRAALRAVEDKCIKEAVKLQEDVGLQRSEEHTSELQSPCNLVCRLLLEKKKKKVKASMRSARSRTRHASR